MIEDIRKKYLKNKKIFQKEVKQKWSKGSDINLQGKNSDEATVKRNEDIKDIWSLAFVILNTCPWVPSSFQHSL